MLTDGTEVPSTLGGMTALEMTFTVLAVAGFAATAWIAGVVVLRLVKGPKR